MVAVVALELVKSSLRLITAIAIGETPTAQETQDSLRVLNDLLETWSTENLTVYTQESNTFALVPGQAAYTVGAAGNWVMTRPVEIASAYVRLQGPDYPLEQVSDDWYNLIETKAQSGQIPCWFKYDADFPLGVITLWPVPNAAGSITLTSNKQFSAVPNVATVISYPPGYSKALRHALAIDLAGEFGVPVPANVVEVARYSKAAIKRANNRSIVSRADPALLGDQCHSLGQFLGGNF